MDLHGPNIERLLAAFYHKKIDRVSHWELDISSPTLEFLLDCPYPPPARSSWYLPSSDYLKMCQSWPNDAMGINCGYRGTIGHEERGTIKDWCDIEKMRKPESVAGRRDRLSKYIAAARGTSVGVAPLVWGPLMVACEALGVEGLGYKVYDDLKFVEHLLDIFTSDARAMAEGFADMDIDFVYVADDIAFNNGPILHPAMMEQLWLPRMSHIIEPIKARCIPMAFHCCGNLSKIIPWLIHLGFLAVQPVQPTCNDIYALKRQYAGRICLIGNIDVADCLSFGTVDDVVREVREHIAALAYDGGYVCGSSHSITASVKPENYAAMVEAIIEYGVYK